MAEPRWLQASRLMDTFAEDTGLTGARPPRRYLWTDAHAVCNWLSLERETSDPRYLGLATALVTQVHQVLGRHRSDDSRSGWISGLAYAEGAQHPTSGGLRIGKPLPERRRDAPQDQHVEWDQDGQYYHYLTRWMHALHQMASRSGETEYHRWAVELALAAYRGFLARTGPARLYWKMSIDLTYPLVASSGLHDPLDGLITSLVLRNEQPDSALDEVISDLGELCSGRSWLTDDPLGIGGLLFDAGRIAQMAQGKVAGHDINLLAQLLNDAADGLFSFTRAGSLQRPANQRLAFRELGLSIGLQVPELIRRREFEKSVSLALERLYPYRKVQELIEYCWLQPQHRQVATWADHEDINAVMLATSLTAPGFLSI